MTITENNTLEMKNVVSFRGKVTQQKMEDVMRNFENLIHENKACKTGPTVTATYAVENEFGQSVMDIEVLIPLDKKIATYSDFKFKPLFRLNNAVKIRHEGNPAMLQNSANELMQYINSHDLMPITAGYNVTVREPASQNDVDNMIVDMYVGVCDNIL
jgi:effector-binding domain-containing protein